MGLLWIVGIAAASCVPSEDRIAGSDYELRDSAGIEIVANGSVGALGDSLLTLTEELRIGVSEGPPEYELYRVTGVRLDRNGNVYAYLAGAGEIRVYDAGGGHLRTFGRLGDGPGEFRGASLLPPAGDTLFVFDGALQRFSSFTLEGELIQGWPFRVGRPGGYPEIRTERGWLMVLYPETEIPELLQSVARPLRIAQLPGRPEMREPPPEGVQLWDLFDVVFEYADRPLWGVGDGGNQHYELWGPAPAHAIDSIGRIYHHAGAFYPIDVRDPGGALIRRVSRTDLRRPVTEELRERYRAAVVERYAGRPSETISLQRLGFSNAAFLPALGELVVSPEGAIWVERPDKVDDPLHLVWDQQQVTQQEHWDVFDPEGRFLGGVALDRRSRIHAVGTDWMLVTERDELDVEYIVRYRAGPPAG